MLSLSQQIEVWGTGLKGAGRSLISSTSSQVCTSPITISLPNGLCFLASLPCCEIPPTSQPAWDKATVATLSATSSLCCPHSRTLPAAGGRTQSLAPDASCPHILPGLELAAFSELSHDILARAPPQHPATTPEFQLNTAASQSRVLRAQHVSTGHGPRIALPALCTDWETEAQKGPGLYYRWVTEQELEFISPYSQPGTCLLKFVQGL